VLLGRLQGLDAGFSGSFVPLPTEHSPFSLSCVLRRLHANSPRPFLPREKQKLFLLWRRQEQFLSSRARAEIPGRPSGFLTFFFSRPVPFSGAAPLPIVGPEDLSPLFGVGDFHQGMEGRASFSRVSAMRSGNLRPLQTRSLPISFRFSSERGSFPDPILRYISMVIPSFF